MALLLAASLSSNYLIIRRGPPSCRWPPTAQSFRIVPRWQRVLGQGSRTVRSLCHTSPQAGHGQPLAQPGVLKNQGNATNLQGCLPRLFSNRAWLTGSVRLCLAAVMERWGGWGVGRLQQKLTQQHDGTFVASPERRSHQLTEGMPLKSEDGTSVSMVMTFY